MRKPLFLATLTLAILSAFGMFYFHYFRFDCKPLSDRRLQDFPKGTTQEMWRDWEGNCFLTITPPEQESKEYPGVFLTVGPYTWKWVNGEWTNLEYEPYNPYKKKGRP